MPAPRVVTLRQMELLLDFVESHREIALGKRPGGPLASRAARQAWEAISIKLNSVPKGSIKTPDKWRRYWIEFKAKTRGKAADHRRGAPRTGGVPNKFLPLNDIEKRTLRIIGSVAAARKPRVRLPIDIPTADDGSDTDVTATKSFTQFISCVSSKSRSPEKESSTANSTPTPSEAISVEFLDEVAEPEVDTSREDGCHRPRSSPPPHRRSRSQKSERDEHVSVWANNTELRRIAAEERHADAMEALVVLVKDIRDDVRSYSRITAQERQADAMEAMVSLVKDIRDDIRGYFGQQ